MTERLDQVLGKLESWGRDRDWTGPDPYEGLNSPLGRLARGRRPRQVVIQAYKRLPFEPVPPLRARPRPNAKTVALVLSGYAAARSRFGAAADERIAALPGWLEALSLRDAPVVAWGYHFDFQSRWHFYSGATPNAIATCFVIEALLDAGQPDLALRARPFLLRELLVERGGRRFFGYTPDDPPLVHNANALVCGALARLHHVEPDESAAAIVADAAATTIEAQRGDGSWPYGENQNIAWVDNFHTAYTLEGLKRVSATYGTSTAEVERGLAFWRERLIEPDGTARYFPDRRDPVEAHSYASAIDLAVLLGDLALAHRLTDAAIRDLWLADEGRFAFARTARGLNKRTFVRWTNAPMFRALARLDAAGLRLRPATRDDAELLLEWRNDPEVLAVSGNSQRVELAAHTAWLEGVIAAADRHLLIAERGGAPVGQVRFDACEGGGYEISVSVDRSSRGGGTGSALIAAGTEWLFDNVKSSEPVIAHVKPANERSLRSFTRAGYVRAPDSDRPGFLRLTRSLTP